MDRPSSLAAAIESAAESLIGVLDGAVTAAAGAVSPTQLRVLAVIDRLPGANLNRLAEQLDVVPSSASRLCDRLEAIGLVRRIVDVRDRREVRLQLTPAGLRLLAGLKEQRRRAVAVVLDRLPPRAQHDLLRCLDEFAAAARAGTEESQTAARTA